MIFPELRTFKQIQFCSSFLIAGPEKSGKTTLTNAICTETGSLKIELTLENLSENYTNVEDINRLINIIVKVVDDHFNYVKRKRSVTFCVVRQNVSTGCSRSELSGRSIL